MKRWNYYWLPSFWPLCAVALLAAGCGEGPATESDESGNLPGGDKYLLAAEPEGAQGVIEVRKDAQDDAEVVVVGRIGGSTNPWVEDRAAFWIVDPTIEACADDCCKTPWDYCCKTDQLPDATVLVKVVDESGNLIEADARKFLGVKELQAVVVQGKAQRDDAGNLTILADGIHIRP